MAGPANNLRINDHRSLRSMNSNTPPARRSRSRGSRFTAAPPSNPGRSGLTTATPPDSSGPLARNRGVARRARPYPKAAPPSSPRRSPGNSASPPSREQGSRRSSAHSDGVLTVSPPSSPGGSGPTTAAPPSSPRSSPGNSASPPSREQGGRRSSAHSDGVVTVSPPSSPGRSGPTTAAPPSNPGRSGLTTTTPPGSFGPLARGRGVARRGRPYPTAAPPRSLWRSPGNSAGPPSREQGGHRSSAHSDGLVTVILPSSSGRSGPTTVAPPSSPRSLPGNSASPPSLLGNSASPPNLPGNSASPPSLPGNSARPPSLPGNYVPGSVTVHTTRGGVPVVEHVQFEHPRVPDDIPDDIPGFSRLYSEPINRRENRQVSVRIQPSQVIIEIPTVLLRRNIAAEMIRVTLNLY